MNDRYFLNILLALFSVLAAVEICAAAMFGLRTELVLFIFVIAAAFSGIAVVLRLMHQQRPEIESVSMRRARAMHDDTVKERIREYGLDEEFLSGKPAPSAGTSTSVSCGEGKEKASGVSLEDAIMLHAAMFGGLRELLVKMETIDEISYERLLQDAGLQGVSRSDLLRRIRLMVSVEGEECAKACSRSLEEAMEAFSGDRESFDDYIRRSMSSGQGHMEMDEEGDTGFSVELDTASLSKAGGTMPEDFSHDPKSVIARLRQKGRPS